MTRNAPTPDGTNSRSHRAAARAPGTKSAAVVGAGNIGSFAIGLLARLPSLGRLTIVDRDRYEAKNVRGQDITARDAGLAKAPVQARRARRINPALAVEALVEPVENVPLGRLRADVVFACVDSRQARRYLNHAAWRIGAPLIDAGVCADGLLARVDVYVPGPDAPCLECGWSEADYEALEQAYPCGDRSASPAPTNAPASLGALAAALQVVESEQLLRGQVQDASIARQIVFDARSPRLVVTPQQRNARCRFDHRTFEIQPLSASPARLSVRQVLALAPVARGVHGELTLRVEGKSFLTEVRCPGCGDARPAFLRLSGRLLASDATCAHCGRERVVAGFDRVERLSALLPESHLARRLSSFGFRRGDVFTLATAQAEAHFEIGAR